MSPGSNKRPTGTVPKTKPDRKNSVPQEMVAPTRRDLQEHLNEFFASVAERAAAKPENNQTRAAGTENCFDLDNLGLQENTRYWPVRPIPRRNFLHEDNNMTDSHTPTQTVGGTNTAIGVVIPTTPNSSVFHQQYNDQQQLQHHFNNLHRQGVNRTPDSIGTVNDTAAIGLQRSGLIENTQPQQQHHQQQSVAGAVNATQSCGIGATANVEERINQIQEYIRITSTLINSIQAEKSSPENIEDIVVLSKNLENLRDSEQKLMEIKTSDEYQTIMDNPLIFSASSQNECNGTAGVLNSVTLENVCSPTEPNGPRPQSVASLYASTPNTPTYEELQSKLEASNRNMLHIKEQQQQLLRLQHTAKQQLTDMEQIRDQHGPMTFAGNVNALPDYENAEDVQHDVETLMSRMKTLNDFIRNQNELASLLGADKCDVLEEQIQLQQKLAELKNKKQQMADLVNELQQMSSGAANEATGSAEPQKQQHQHQSARCQPEAVRNVPVDYERIVPIEMVQNQRIISAPRYSTPLQNNHRPTEPPKQRGETTEHPIVVQRQSPQQRQANNDEDDDEPNEDEDEDVAGADSQDSGISEKIAEINAMKSQLKRLQDMMATVKLIELKNGDGDPDSSRSSRSQSHFEPSPQSTTLISAAATDSAEQYNSTNGRQPSLPKSLNNSNAVEPTQCDEEVQMDERVRALHSMTQDLRLQAISLAAERDRLKDIKNEMFRRREVEADKNSKSKRETNVSSPVAGTAAVCSAKEQHDQDVLKSAYAAKKMEFDKLVEKLDNDRENRRARELSQTDTLKNEEVSDVMLSPESNWRQPPENISAASSVRSGQGRHSMPSSSNKQNPTNGPIKGKDSTDSGAADVLGMSVDAGSMRSGSSRGFSVPPPMRNIGRDAPPWRKTSQETSRISSINQANSNFDNPHDGYPPSWYYHNNYFNQGYGMVPPPPQSPHCHYHHHMAGEQHYCRPPPPMYHSAMQPPATTASNSDPMLLQQFIQTQQMLINSVCQCNQLLWDQQREINNLNSAVILLQERILNTSNNDVITTVRPESVPPNVTCTNTQSFLPRAQSEQPLSSHLGCYSNGATTANYNNAPQQQVAAVSARFTQYPFACQNHSSQMYHRTPQHNNNMADVNRVMRLSSTGPSSVGQQQQLLNKRTISDAASMNFYQNEIANAAVYPNNFINPLMQMHHIPLSQSSNVSHNSVPSNVNLLNNDPNVQCQSQSTSSPPPPPIFINNNNAVAAAATAAAAAAAAANNAVSSNININQLHQQQQQHQHIAAAPLNNSAITAAANNSAFSPPVPPALNNQVPPGNRANNYWDNFRSYSRQNLLSSNSCKSNEDAYSASNSPHNRDQTGRNAPLPTQMTHNILPANASGSNKYSIHFRNQINQHSAAAAAAAAAQSSSAASSASAAATTTRNATLTTIAPPDVLNVNQHHHHSHSSLHHHHHDNASGGHNESGSSSGGGGAVASASNYINLNIASGGNHQAIGSASGCAQSSGTGNCNINLELNELKPCSTTKMLPKSATGGNKRIRQFRERDQNNLSTNQTASMCNSASGIDLNLASTSLNRSDSKSSEKLFEALKENVYLEVSALITANESRPHFLINLFRELQLISTSDPLRDRLMQAFQELYNRYCEPTIAEENNAALPPNEVITPDTAQHDLTQSSDNRYNHSTTSVDYPSADSTPVRVPDLHASIDEEILRSIMLEVAEFLIAIDHINEGALQRVTTIVLRHMNGPTTGIGNKPTINLSKHYHLISHDELLRNLIQIDRRNRECFMEGLETYLSTLIACSSSSGGTSSTTPVASVVQPNEIEDELYQQQSLPRRRQDNSFLDLTTSAASVCKSNELLSAMRKKEETNTLADVAAVIGNAAAAHLASAEDNQDLAEADQICNTSGGPNDDYSTEDDFNASIDVASGAVGGAISSTLPDLAKVNTIPPNNSMLDEESVWMVNEEVERLTSQSNAGQTIDVVINNTFNDSKQNNH